MADPDSGTCSCGAANCPCEWCHFECGLDHSPTLPGDAFPTAALCNRHCPSEAWLPTLVGLPGMKGASMLMPIAYLKKWSERMYLWGGPPNPDVRRIFYHPPHAGELNPMLAAGEWKAEPPDPLQENAIDIERLSLTLQAELKRQLDAKTAQAAAPETPVKRTARVGRTGLVSLFDPRTHTVTEVLAYLRNATPDEQHRVVAIERHFGEARRGVLKRYKEVGL